MYPFLSALRFHVNVCENCNHHSDQSLITASEKGRWTIAYLVQKKRKKLWHSLGSFGYVNTTCQAMVFGRASSPLFCALNVLHILSVLGGLFFYSGSFCTKKRWLKVSQKLADKAICKLSRKKYAALDKNVKQRRQNVSKMTAIRQCLKNLCEHFLNKNNFSSINHLPCFKMTAYEKQAFVLLLRIDHKTYSMPYNTLLCIVYCLWA